MPLNTLTDRTIRALKSTAKPTRHFDGGGLYLEVSPTGSKLWRLKYRVTGKEKRLALGVYPEVSLVEAREQRERAREALRQGVDPSAKKQALKASRQGATGDEFEVVAREWLTTVHERQVSAGHAARTLDRFENDIFPSLGQRPIGEIEPADLLQVLRKIEARGAIETAHRAKNACGQVFRYGIATGRCVRNAAADLKDALRPVLSRHHAAITDPAELAKLLRTMDEYQGHPVTRAALTLSALLLLRPGELRHMEWRWLNLDDAMLTVPPEVMKRRKAEKASGPPHFVPLAPQAVSVLRELHPLTGAGVYVFPSLHSAARCMSENTVIGALRRMGYANDEMTAHGFRATARTMLAERVGIAPEVIEAQLAHTVPDALGRAYNRTQYLEQRIEMMGRWGDYLDKLKAGARVIPLRPGAASSATG